jgi:hypothetical protein
VIDAAVASARRRLGTELVSAYAIGSLAHGGFSVVASDVDLALLTAGDADSRNAEVVEAIHADVRTAIGGELSERLSIFHVPWRQFGSPPRGSRFPAIDRQDLVQSGVPVHGEDLRATFAVPPTDEEIREQAICSALQRHTPQSLSAEMNRLSPTAIDVRAASKLVLWPIRLLHVAETAAATGNDDAVEHYTGIAGAAHVRLARLALQWRRTGEVADPAAAHAALTADLFALHHEIFKRLSQHPRLPHITELAVRASEFGTLPPSRGREAHI